MKIVVTGPRGIPNIQGGVETHCEELYIRLVELGHDVTILRRSTYVTSDNKLSAHKGVKLHDIFAPRKKSIEATVHTFSAIRYAKKVKADIVHIHAIGPALLVPFARLLGLKVVVTHHGPDYDRKKWGHLAKFILKLGEKMGAKYANEVIIISEVINKIIKDKYNRTDAHLIYNGVNIPNKSTENDYLKELKLEEGKYILAMGRFVEEKGFDGLIKAFSKSNNKDYKLVIAGDADHEDTYSTSLRQLAKDNNITLTGFIKGEKLNQVLSHARLFVLPSFHEGLPIALLEAMSYDLDVLVSDIPANKEVKLSKDDYFRSGDWGDLQAKLEDKLKTANIKPKQYDLSPYDWDNIAKQVDEVYKKLK